MTRFCASCGTEVEENAVFCPTCGQPIDEATRAEIPPAPAWPEHAPEDTGTRIHTDHDSVAPESAGRADEDARADRSEQPMRTEERPGRPDRTGVPARHAAVAPEHRTAEGPSSGPLNLPVTMPVTLSAWLIGGGAAFAALGVLIGLFVGFLNPVDIVLLLALVAIAVTVFFSANVPHIPNLRLVTLAVVLIGFGMALDRLSLSRAGIGELMLFLGTAAAAIGAILLELGRDQPLGGAQR
ncbi:MAG: zinc-ribbon domain-containing protein [Chloroflexota bacterium]|nr:zinc-ribbon domain-containing protein [Chloroflexota bacterium]